MIGRRLGAYELEDLLRKDVLTAVYRARRLGAKEIDPRVEIRLIDPRLVDAQDLERYLADARRLLQTTHPHLLPILEIGREGDTSYVVTDVLPSTTLKRLLAESDFSVESGLDILIQTAAGVAALHESGITHRRLSPASVVIDRGIARITDIGLTDWGPSRASMSQEILVTGAAEYFAPEQIRGAATGPMVDVFAFGVMLYEVISGVRPFHAEHPVTALHKILYSNPDPVETHAQGCPPSLVRLVTRCLSKDPSRRPSNMGNVGRELSDICGSKESLRIRRISGEALSRSRANPYLNRSMIRDPRDFFGRGKEARWIYSRLNAMPPGSLSIIGERRSGKSSLLNFVYQPANRSVYLDQPENVVMVFMDLQSNLTMSAFFKTLLEMAQIELQDRVSLGASSLDFDGIREAVETLDGAGYKLIILLDEFEKVTGNPEFTLEFFSFLRFLANHYSVAYVTSSTNDLQSLCHTQVISDSPFFNIFSSIRLASFHPKEAEELIRVPSERSGRPLSAYSKEILELSGLLPFFIQMACAHAWEDVVGDNDRPEFDAVRRRFQADALPHFRAAWSGFGPLERSVLCRIARKKAVPDSAVHALQELAARGYVREEEGRWLPFASSFGQFLLDCEGTGAGRLPPRIPWKVLGMAGAAAAVILALLIPALWKRQEPPGGDRGLPLVDLNRNGHVDPTERIDLHLLAVGVSRYRDGRFALRFSDDDAVGIAKAFRRLDGKLFNVSSRVLVDSVATEAAILRELRSVRDSAVQGSFVVISLSGHGELDRSGRFFFLPFDFNAGEETATSGISKEDVFSYLRDTPCPVLVLLDTCHSGEFASGAGVGVRGAQETERAVWAAMEDFSKMESGIVVMAACLGRETALEEEAWGHGALTLAFLEAMTGEHLIPGPAKTQLPQEVLEDPVISLEDISHYVTRRVKEVAGGAQRVKTYSPNDLSLVDIPMTLRDDGAATP